MLTAETYFFSAPDEIRGSRRRKKKVEEAQRRIGVDAGEKRRSRESGAL